MAYQGKKRRQVDDDFVDDDNDGSDSGNVGTARRTPAKKEAIKREDGITVCELSKNRKVTVRGFKAMVLVDIREFYSKNDEASMPSKKGISLTLDQWKILRDHAEEIDAAIAELAK